MFCFCFYCFIYIYIFYTYIFPVYLLNRVIYALQADGKIWTICPFSLLYTNVLDVDNFLEDFIITEDSSDGTRQMLMLSKPNKGSKCLVKLADYKGTATFFIVVVLLIVFVMQFLYLKKYNTGL
jgi:hypothetical protein